MEDEYMRMSPGEDAETLENLLSRALSGRGLTVRRDGSYLREDFLETKDTTLVLLMDLSDIGDDITQEIEEDLDDIEREILSEYGLYIHTDLYSLERYWGDLQALSPRLVSEISKGISVYDPEGLFVPVRRAIQKGLLPNTLQTLEYEILTASKRIDDARRMVRSDVLRDLYESAVETVQAAIVSRGDSPPVQKEIPDSIERHLVGTTAFTLDDAKKAKRIITAWKDLEHGVQVDDLDIDALMEDCDSLVETARAVVEG